MVECTSFDLSSFCTSVRLPNATTSCPILFDFLLFVFLVAARGAVGDACDADEWETATEGSSDPECSSSNAGTGDNLTLPLPSHTDDNVTVCATSKQATTDPCSVQSMANGSLSLHHGVTNVADCANSGTSLSSTLVVSSAPSSSIGPAGLGLNQTNGSGRAGCQLHEHDKYPHDRRGSGGGSGGRCACPISFSWLRNSPCSSVHGHFSFPFSPAVC